MIDELQSLGLSQNEAKIYLSLLEQGESGVGAIATKTGIHRRNVYDTIERLVEKGLCFPIISSTENHYNAVDPGKLTEILAEKQQQLETILPQLHKKYTNRLAPEEAFIYRGLEGQKNLWRDILRVGQDSYFIGAKGGWFDPALTSSRKAFFAEAKRKGIGFIQLFDREPSDMVPDFYQLFPKKLKFRILPKEYSTNSAINIFGDYVVTYTGLEIGKIGNNVVFFVIRSKDLAASYRTWFDYMWQQSKDR